MTLSFLSDRIQQDFSKLETQVINDETDQKHVQCLNAIMIKAEVKFVSKRSCTVQTELKSNIWHMLTMANLSSTLLCVLPTLVWAFWIVCLQRMDR